MELTKEITQELLSDIATVLRSIAHDFFPNTPLTVNVQTERIGFPDCVVLRIPGRTSKAVQITLKELAKSMCNTTDRVLPSLPLRYTVIGGSEASGIEITAKSGAKTKPVYGHIIKAKAAWLRPSEKQRRRN